MVAATRFRLVYDSQVEQHLKAVERKYRSLIRQKIEEQLQFEPDTETLNRKPLSRPAEFGANWEIRFGPGNQFRVFYEVDRSENKVYILAVGVKKRNRLFIGGKEIHI